MVFACYPGNFHAIYEEQNSASDVALYSDTLQLFNNVTEARIDSYRIRQNLISSLLII